MTRKSPPRHLEFTAGWKQSSLPHIYKVTYVCVRWIKRVLYRPKQGRRRTKKRVDGNNKNRRKRCLGGCVRMEFRFASCQLIIRLSNSGKTQLLDGFFSYSFFFTFLYCLKFYIRSKHETTNHVRGQSLINRSLWNLACMIGTYWIKTSQNFRGIVPLVWILQQQSHYLWNALCIIQV